MSKQLDRSRPYAEIFGVTDPVGARYEQGNRYYDQQGDLIGNDDPPIQETATAVAPTDEPHEPEHAPSPRGADDANDLHRLHWRNVKKMVEAAGGTWTDKDAGIEFLMGLPE